MLLTSCNSKLNIEEQTAQKTTQENLTACKSNLKNIGTACEMYAADNNGRYPSSLSQLNETTPTSYPYLKVLPSCPVDNAPYEYKAQAEPDCYVVHCTGDHSKAGVTAGYPSFDSIIGLTETLSTPFSMDSYGFPE